MHIDIKRLNALRSLATGTIMLWQIIPHNFSSERKNCLPKLVVLTLGILAEKEGLKLYIISLQTIEFWR